MNTQIAQRSWRITRESQKERYIDVPFTSNIQDYELLSPIGGVDDMSYMYLSKFRPTGDLIALKYTDLTISPDVEFIEELIAIVTNTSNHRHPNLLPYFTSFTENERLWTVTLPMKAGNCRSVLKEFFPNGFSESSVSTIIKELLKGLCYLHSQGITHKDIRADNILMDTSGDIRLTGFHQLEQKRRRPSDKAIAYDFFAQPEWVAPECLESNVPHNEKVDIYSLGITALELAFGKTPYHEWPPLKIVIAKLQLECPIESIIPPESLKKPFSRHFFHFVKYCVQYNAARRPTAKQLLQHSFMKLSKGKPYLKTKLIKRSGLIHKHAVALVASPVSATSPSSYGPPSPQPSRLSQQQDKDDFEDFTDTPPVEESNTILSPTSEVNTSIQSFATTTN